jgi:uncharacterized membrane protein
MTPQPLPLFTPEPGRGAAFVAYVLFLMSIPSAGILALVGVVVAYAAREDAQGVGRAHLEHQIRYWWLAVWWGTGIAVATFVGLVLSVVLIGIPIVMLAALAGLVVMIWFTVKSVFGLIALLDGRPR